MEIIDFFRMNGQLFLVIIISCLACRYVIKLFWWLMEKLFASPILALLVVVAVFVMFNLTDK